MRLQLTKSHFGSGGTSGEEKRKDENKIMIYLFES